VQNGFGSELFSNKKNEGLEPTLSNDRLKMKGWNRHCQMINYKMMGWNRRCRMIGKKIRAGSDIVNSSSHFLMIGSQLCCQLCHVFIYSKLIAGIEKTPQ
jgi:hypothetical protein